jgi:hypothetical protein
VAAARDPRRQLVPISLLGFPGFCLTMASIPSWVLAGGVTEAAAGSPTAQTPSTCTATGQTSAASRSRPLTDKTSSASLRDPTQLRETEMHPAPRTERNEPFR